MEDFILSVKLQAEYCSFGNFKSLAIRDRIVAGIRDKSLQQRLLNEEALTLDSAEKIIATWEMASVNARSLEPKPTHFVHSLINPNLKVAKAYDKLDAVYRLSEEEKEKDRKKALNHQRGPVKARLGFQNVKRFGNNFGMGNSRFQSFGQNDAYRQRQRPDYSSMICGYCKKKGHIIRIIRDVAKSHFRQKSTWG